MTDLISQGFSGAAFAIVVFYLLACASTRQWVRIDFYELALSMTIAFLVAIVCEVGLGQLYRFVTGEPLWQYRVWPIHDGFTSVLNFMIWPIYGYYSYLLGKVMHAHRFSFIRRWHRGMLAGLDGPLLEVLANGFFLSLYGSFYFYYLPDDLWHLTSVRVIPLYMLMGVALVFVLGYFQARPRDWRYPAGFYLTGAAFILLG